MAHTLKLQAQGLQEIRKMNPRLMSYNVEMTEVTGGTFWKAYTEGQIAGTEEFPKLESFTNHTALAGLMQYYPPIDTKNEKLISLARELGPVWVRVSGTWATKTYYDFDGTTGGKAPEGYQSVLTKEQWLNILDFVKAIGAKLIVSVSNCAGDHKDIGPLDLTQTKKLFALTYEHGSTIDAVEFMNEPNMLQTSGAPAGYDFPDYIRDHDLFNAWVRENYPECLIVGPCNTGMADNDTAADNPMSKMGAGMGNMMRLGTAKDLLDGAKVALDVYSYHYYNGISERLASVMPTGHWPAEAAHTDAYLAVAPGMCMMNVPVRDKYVPGAEMWVTESGDAGGGGDTWASTYLDVLRTLNELGSFCNITNGVIFHNTLASSDYGFLQHGTFDPRPNYFAVLLWTKLMGDTVYACENPAKEGAHVYCHDRKDGKDGYAYLIINNSLTDTTTVELAGDATLYTLGGNGDLRSKVMYLNGKPLTLGENNELPALNGTPVSGKIELAPGTCSFILV